MTREEIEQAALRYVLENDRPLRVSDLVCVATEQVRAALKEAADLIDGVGKAEHNDAEKIRGLMP